MQIRHFYRQRYTRIILSWILIVVLATGFTACKPEQPEQPQELQGGGAGAASWILQQILSGALSYTGSKCMGWLLSLVSGGSGNDQNAADFAQMEGDLTLIINDLAIIQGQLKDLAYQIQLDMATINKNDQSLYLAQRESIIDNTYANMQALSSTMIGTAQGKTEAALLANQIITGTTSIDQQLFDIYYLMVGKAAGLQSALDAFTDVLVAQDPKTGPTDPQVLNRYLALEMYFKQLVQIQLKGAALMVEGLHYRDNPWDNATTKAAAKTIARPYGLGDYPGTAEQWMTKKFQPQLEEQVEEFLRCTDRLVLFYSELRTDITTTNPAVSMLPADADNIFSRADFIAAQLSSRHSFGLNVRMVGEPDEIQNFTNNPSPPGTEYFVEDWSTLTEHNMTIVPLGSSTDNGYPARLNPVEKWWFWPAGYTQAYIQWNWGSYATGTSAGTVSGHISFNSATDIAVAKYNDPTPPAANMLVVTSQQNEAAQIGQWPNTMVHLMDYYNDDMDIVAAGTAGAHYYGHGTLTIRHRPEAWYQYRSTINGQDVYSGTADCSLGSPINVRAIAELHQNYYGVDEDFDIESAIALPLINGTTSQHKIGVFGNMQADANNSFHEVYLGNQDRITGWWEWNNTPEWDWWAIKLGNPVTYGGTTAYHYFDPKEAFTYAIMVELHGNAEGNQGNSLGCRAWPQSLYLFF